MEKPSGNGTSFYNKPPPFLTKSSPPPLRKTPPPLPQNDIDPALQVLQAKREQAYNERAASLLDEAEMERFKNLIIFAKTAVESRYNGRHKSPDLGGGGEFSEYTSYDPSQSIQAIDWRVYGRSKRLVVRRYRQETDMDVHLLVDASGSMAYRGALRETKGLHAARIAAALAYLMLQQGDKASITLLANKVLEHIPASGTRRHLMNMLRSLVKPAHEAGGRTQLPNAIRECERLISRRGRIVILSDFLGHQPEEIFEALAPFTHRGCEVLLMHLIDPDEIILPNAALAQFVDMETGQTIQVEPSEIRAEHEARMRGKIDAFATGAALYRMDFIALDTASPYREAIEAYLGFRNPKH